MHVALLSDQINWALQLVGTQCSVSVAIELDKLKWIEEFEGT